MRVGIVAIILAGCTSACAQHQNRAAELRIMSFNVRYGTAEDGENHWEKRRELVFDVFRRHQPDVVGTQEALRFQLDEIRAALPGYSEVGVGRDDGRTQGEYTAILYRRDRFDVIEHGTFWLSETPDVPGSKSWGAACPRICTWVKLRDRPSGRAFAVYNVHLDHVSQLSREKGVSLLLEYARRRGADNPVFLIGDFNAAEDNPAIRAIAGAGWADSYRVVLPEAKDVGTFHAWTGAPASAKIDFVFTPPGFEVLDATILRDNRANRYPSDHFPVMAIGRLAR